MLDKNLERLEDVRARTIEILDDLTISQKLALQALEKCDSESFEQVKIPLKQINKKADDIDNLILTVCALYSPEAKDLREMIAFLKITSSLQRIANNEKNYMKNMAICNPDSDEEIKRVIKETEDIDRLKELAAKIDVEYSKTDDIYSLIEKDLLQTMHQEHKLNEEHINLLKYIRKNLKIVDRLEDIVSRLIFARMGGKL